jgi:hypothetical protein
MPVGTPLTAGNTVAVNVTDWPNTDVFAEEVTAVVVLCPATCRVPKAGALPGPWHPAPLVAVKVKG